MRAGDFVTIQGISEIIGIYIRGADDQHNHIGGIYRLLRPDIFQGGNGAVRVFSDAVGVDAGVG